jgi:hypothetical protein
MTDLISRLQEIREQQGREPLPDPGVIQGFGEDAPPPPEFRVRPDVDLSQVPEAPAEYIDEDPFEEVKPVPEAKAFMSKPDLTVLGMDDGGYIASHLDRQVELTATEGAIVKTVVLRAIQRVVRAQLDELSALLPKRKRRKPEAAEKPKRGRPRKQVAP